VEVVTMVWALMLLSIAVAACAVFHVAHLPVAPQCPDCRSVTMLPLRPTLLDRLLGQLGNAAARECPRCGWAGRMRWRLALHRTPPE
jgi:hypothetical protein